MKPITVLLQGDVLVCDRLLVTHSGVLLFFPSGRVVLLPMKPSDADWVKFRRGEVTRIDVNAPFVEIHHAG